MKVKSLLAAGALATAMAAAPVIALAPAAHAETTLYCGWGTYFDGGLLQAEGCDMEFAYAEDAIVGIIGGTYEGQYQCGVADVEYGSLFGLSCSKVG